MKREKYYPPANGPCVHCYYARMRTDICGIYCTGVFVKTDGTCEKFRFDDPKQEREERGQNGHG